MTLASPSPTPASRLATAALAVAALGAWEPVDATQWAQGDDPYGLVITTAGPPPAVDPLEPSPWGAFEDEEEVDAPAPGTPGGPGLAIHARKLLTLAEDGPPVVDNGVLLVLDGAIQEVGRARDVSIPDGYVEVDVGDHWLMPGMVDLHSHVAGASEFNGDLHDYVFLTNPGLRASSTVVPGNPALLRALAAGVTTILYIPGSGANMSGQGVLLKTGFDRYEDMVLRDPGSLKLAQAGNPERYYAYEGSTIGRAFMNWNTRDTFRRGLAYAETWAARIAEAEALGTEPPVRDPQWDVFHPLLEQSIAVSTHTQLYQVVLTTITMVRLELGLKVFLDHSTYGGWRTGALAEESGVPAIVGPSSIDGTGNRFLDDVVANGREGIQGVAAGYQELGHTQVGFNTDAPIVPQEELQLQAGMAVRYGFDDAFLETVRGLTIVPARAAGIEDVVGSLEVGKHADVLIIAGHPADPRSQVARVLIQGHEVYDMERDGQRW